MIIFQFLLGFKEVKTEHRAGGIELSIPFRIQVIGVIYGKVYLEVDTFNSF